jgi:zinc protease
VKTLLPFLVAAAALAQQTVPSPGELKYPPLKQIRIPDITTFTLPNGIRVYLLENHELPVVNGTALVRTGNLFEPPDKIGLAGMTGSVMRSGGTRAKTGDELDEQLENIAASVESSIGETSGQVSFSTLKENVDEVMSAFRDVLTEPEFRPDKIELAKVRLRSSILRRNDDAGAIANREYSSIVYGRDNPYGWRMELAHVENIRRDDLIAFYRRYFFPANIMLAVYGDFSTAEMRARVEKLLGGWTYTQPQVPPFPPLERKPSPGVFFANKDDVNQAFLQVGHLGGILKDKDTPALQIMADILGGGFSSRLFQRVRTKLGYAYGIGAGWGAGYLHPGLFEISGSTRSETTVATLRAIREEVERIRSSPVTDQELRTAKDTVVNSFVFAFDTPAKTLSRMLRYEYYGYPRDFIFQYQKAIAAVTKDDVLRVAKEHLKPDNFTVVAVGNTSEFGTPLTELGLPVKEIDLTIPKPGPAKGPSGNDAVRRPTSPQR